MKFMAKNRVEKKVPPIFTFWVVSYMPCQFDKFDENIKNKEILHFPTEPASTNILFFCL